MGLRPQTLYPLADSPAGLAAWMLDHGDGGGQPAAGLVSGINWEYKGGFFNVKGASIPVAVSVFPGEQYQAPRNCAEQTYPNLIYFDEIEKGGHFPACEQPELCANRLRAAFKSLRTNGGQHEHRRDRNPD
jgi:pimeloyl-ACP methyl ester carboxylesterase